MNSVGIDAVEIHTGKLRLDLAETFAPAKDESPEKYTKGLGLHSSSFPDAGEDIVTMGANAAHRLMRRKGLEPEDIGRIDVATESAFDNSKPVSTYIAGCLEQVFDVRTIDFCGVAAKTQFLFPYLEFIFSNGHF